MTEMFETINETRPAAPHRSSPTSTLLDRHADDSSGEVATYIPELASADPDLFGICLVTVDGAVYEAGDTRAAVHDPVDVEAVHLRARARARRAGRGARRVGVEPSGDAFNSISLSPATGTPLNPMINAGAITSAALVLDHAEDPARDCCFERTRDYAGRRLTCRRRRLPLGGRDRPPQPRDRPHAAQLRHSPERPRGSASTCTSGSARSRSTAATSRSSPRRSPTAASTRAPASARCARASSAACSA